MKTLYYLLFFSLIFFGCTKDKAPTRTVVFDTTEETSDVIDTIFPKPYLPLYPGSWWEYIHLTGSSSRLYVEPEYQIRSHLLDSFPHHFPILCDPSYGICVPYFGYSAIWPNYDLQKGILYPCMSEKLGDVWTYATEQRPHGTYKSWVATVVYKDIHFENRGSSYDSVIVIAILWSDTDTEVKSYAKHIGLISDYKINYSTSPPDTLSGCFLTNYWIGK